VWYPDRSKATEKDPPLYLHITAATQEILQKAIDKVDELMNLDLGPLVEDKKDRMREKVSSFLFFFVTSWFNFYFSGSGPKRSYPLSWKALEISTFVLKLLVQVYVHHRRFFISQNIDFADIVPHRDPS
jgi:hypothetical protein